MTEKKTPTPSIPEPELEKAVVDPEATTRTNAGGEDDDEHARIEQLADETLSVLGTSNAYLVDLDAIAEQLGLTAAELDTLEVVQVGLSWTSRTGSRVGKFVRVPAVTA